MSSSKSLVVNATNTIKDTQETIYSAPADKSVLIEAFTVANNDTVNHSYGAYIFTTDSDLAPQIPFRIVVWGENDLGIGIVNQVIPPGGELLVESSEAQALTFTITGREL